MRNEARMPNNDLPYEVTAIKRVAMASIRLPSSPQPSAILFPPATIIFRPHLTRTPFFHIRFSKKNPPFPGNKKCHPLFWRYRSYWHVPRVRTSSHAPPVAASTHPRCATLRATLATNSECCIGVRGSRLDFDVPCQLGPKIRLPRI